MAYIRKVGIIGTSHVGSHVAFSLLLQGLVDELYLCDVRGERLTAEVQDFKDSLSFCPNNCKIVNVGDAYEQLAGCDIIINAAGDIAASAKDRDGELFVTTDIAHTFAARIADAGFAGIWLSIANPCDVVCTEIWRLTGYDPKRIVGSGTALDSARLRHALSEVTGLDQHSINAYMLGEHGNSQFAAMSCASFGCKSLAELAEEQPERFGFDLAEVEQAARYGGYVTIHGKGCTEYAIANAAARLVQAILCNEHYVTCCSTLLKGEHGEEGIFASIPCIVGANGVEETIELRLNEREREAFHASCAHIRGNIAKLGSWWNEESRVK